MGKPGADRSYSRAELVSDGIVHVLGLVLVAAGGPALVAAAIIWRGDAATVLAASVYGLSLVAMLGFSALYNMASGSAWLGVYRRLDHSAIYVKIAGTFTPILLLGGGGGALLAGIWAAALGGVGLKVLSPGRLRWLGLALYLGMGWVGVALGADSLSSLTPTAIALVVAGGLTYTVGVAFYLWDGLRFHNTIWHVFVLAATACFYAAILHELAQ